jgi:predicted nucleotidyltransferase
MVGTKETKEVWRTMILQELVKRKLLHPPQWLPSNTHYLTVMGSIAYGTNTDTSDFDVYGFAVPEKTVVFPHLAGQVEGFGTQKQRFEQYQQHQVFDQDALGGAGRTYDFTIFNIVRYFHLLLENNPNVIDSIFTPIDCVLHATSTANLVRENRKLFLHKGIVHKLKGYAFSQLHKASSENRTGKRAEKVAELGWDAKFLSHVVRLTLQAEQILKTGDLDLRQDREHIKAIKRGEISLEEVRQWFGKKEAYLDKLVEESTLPYKPDEVRIKQLLLDCLEHHYGSLEKCIELPDRYKVLVDKIKELVNVS